MQYATPQALADLLRRDKALLLSAWEQKVKQIPGNERVTPAYLHDHVPRLIDELAEELQHPETAKERLRTFSAAHGEARQQLGLQMQEVVEEYKILRRCILQHAEANGLAVTGDASRVVHEIIDDGVKSAIESYVERRDAAERTRREEYLAFIVHDLRSPLSAIYYAILMAERELQETGVSERVRSIHSAIKRNIDRMRGLIVKLLQEEQNLRTPHEVTIERESVALWAIVESATRTLTPLAMSADTGIENQVPRDLEARLDADRMERVFENLLANAIEYTYKGRVVVGAARTAGDTVECWVSDNGRGVPEGLREKVFEKYVTDGGRRSGAGLGLAVVKQLVEAHGGRIELQSEAGKGTTIRFSIPHA